MATTTDREPSAGLPPTRPFTCSWPKGCPKVSELWACPIFPTSTYVQLTKADALSAEFQPQIRPPETL